MRNVIYGLITATLLPLFASSQNSWNASPHASNLFLELGGNAVYYSFNYDMRFLKGNNGIGGRVGISYIPGARHLWDPATLIPVGVNYLTGKGAHHLEAGAGITFNPSKYRGSDPAAMFVPSLGYRYQPVSKGVTLRVFASGITKDDKLRPWPGFSFGARL